MASNRLLKLSLKRKKDNVAVDTNPPTTSSSENPSLAAHTAQSRSRTGSRFSLVLERVSTPSPKKLKKFDIEVNPTENHLSIADDNDFKKPIEPVTRLSRQEQALQQQCLQSIEDDQLQLALALSASVERSSNHVQEVVEPELQPPGRKRKKKGKAGKRAEATPPLLTVSTQQSREMLAQRAEEIVKEYSDDSSDIPCTPAFASSDLEKVVPFVPPPREDYFANLASESTEETVASEDIAPLATQFTHFDYPTLWELANSTTLDTKNFYVPSLKCVISPVKSSRTIENISSHEEKPTNTPCEDNQVDPNDAYVSYTGVTRLCHDLGSIVNSSLFSDVEITTHDGTVVNAHAVLLAARCSTLRAVISSESKRPIELDFQQYSKKTVLAFIEFLYTGKVPEVSGCDREALAKLAKEWCLDELESACACEEQTIAEQDAIGASIESPVASNHETPPVYLDSIVVLDSNKASPIEDNGLHEQDQVAMNIEDSSPHAAMLCDVIDLSQSSSPEILHNSLNADTMPLLSPQSNELFSPSPPHIDSATNAEHSQSLPDINNIHDLTQPVVEVDSTSPSDKCSTNAVSDMELQSSPQAANKVSNQSEENSFNAELLSYDDIYTDLFEDFATPGKEPSTAAARPANTPAEQLKLVDKKNAFRTPLGVGRYHLETDDDITPMPNYKTMVTPLLKDKCSKFGLKPLAKKKMIAKLEEIYDYTHPVVDADGAIVEKVIEPLKKPASKTKQTKDKASTNKPVDQDNCVDAHDDLLSTVKAAIVANKELHQDILLYKPLELSAIQCKLKEAGLIISREKLRDILDQWCVTFTIPRNSDTSNSQRFTN